MALATAHGTGLRVAEVVALKVGDVDSTRMMLRIEQGKGRRDRYAMLVPLVDLAWFSPWLWLSHGSLLSGRRNGRSLSSCDISPRCRRVRSRGRHARRRLSFAGGIKAPKRTRSHCGTPIQYATALLLEYA